MNHISSDVSKKSKIGNEVKIWNWVKIRENCVIGDSTSIGQCSYIDKNVFIGKNCKIQNGVQIYDGVTICDDVFIGPNVTFTNDLFPRSYNKYWEVKKTKICKGASIGAGSVILCGIEIGEYAMVAAGSVVTKNVPKQTLVSGNPSRIIRNISK